MSSIWSTEDLAMLASCIFTSAITLRRRWANNVTTACKMCSLAWLDNAKIVFQRSWAAKQLVLRGINWMLFSWTQSLLDEQAGVLQHKSRWIVKRRTWLWRTTDEGGILVACCRSTNLWCNVPRSTLFEMVLLGWCLPLSPETRCMLRPAQGKQTNNVGFN